GGAWRKRLAWRRKSRRNAGLGASAGSALGLAAFAHRRDMPAQLVRAHRARHYVAADDVARRAVDAEGVGQLVAFDQRRPDLVALQVAVELRHVGARALGGLARLGAVHLAAGREQ